MSYFFFIREVNAAVDRETEECELKVLEEQWIHTFGPPTKFRTDASGAHMNEQYLRFFNKYGIKLIIIPKEAPYRMGAIERLHAVRRLQLYKMQQAQPGTRRCSSHRLQSKESPSQRAWIFTAQMVFGHNPASGGLIPALQALQVRQLGFWL